MTFELEAARAKLINLNPRPEKHGEENVPACDLKIQIQAGSEILSMFHPTLRAMLFKADESQGQIEGDDVPTVRRFGELIERLRLGTKLVGAEVVIGFGLGGSSDIHLETVDVDGFAVEIMEGGSVILTFRIKATPSGAQMSRLYEVMGGEIDITVTPAIDRQGSLLEAA